MPDRGGLCPIAAFPRYPLKTMWLLAWRRRRTKTRQGSKRLKP